MMKGKQIFEYYQNKRDYTGSKSDTYSQLLQTISVQLCTENEKQDFYNILENAEKLGKKITLSDATYRKDSTQGEINISDILIA